MISLCYNCVFNDKQNKENMYSTHSRNLCMYVCMYVSLFVM